MREEVAEWVDIIFGYRKTIVMIALIILAVIFRVKAYIDGGQLVELLKSTTLAFFGANGLEHISTTIKEFVNSKGQKVASIVADTGNSTNTGA